MHTTRQGFFRVDAGWGREPWAGQVFPTSQVRLMGGAQPYRWLNVFAQARFARSGFTDGPAGEYRTQQRGFFFKASYIYRF